MTPRLAAGLLALALAACERAPDPPAAPLAPAGELGVASCCDTSRPPPARTHVQVLDDLVHAMSGVAEALETVRSADGARAARPRLQQLQAKIGKLTQEGQALGAPPRAAGPELDRLRERIERMTGRARAEFKRIEKLPGAAELLRPALPRAVLRDPPPDERA